MYRQEAKRKLRERKKRIKRLKATFAVVSFFSLAMALICGLSAPLHALDSVTAIISAVFFALLSLASAACSEAVEE